ncbi:MAG: PAS domain S-box protein [Rhodospirillales bacterium]|nr:PAS domain S-box protein [Rhodospirillales bacterium]
MFQLITPISYWVLTVLWLVILGLYLVRLRHIKSIDGTVAVLLTILAVDAFRTVFESAYFGLYFNSLFGMLPKGIYEVLSLPELIIIPKIINVIAGILVLALLIRRWVPRELEERERLVGNLRAAVVESNHNEARLNAILDGISDGVIFVDINRRIVAANKGMEKTFGYTFYDLAGKTTSMLYESEDEYERQGRIRFNLSAKEKTTPYEVSYRHKNGEVFVCETLGATIKGADGEIQGYIGVMRDITERKQVDIQLKSQITFLQTLIDTIPNPIFYKGADGTYLGCNEPFGQFIGKSKEEIIGRTVFEITSKELADKYNKADQDLFNIGGTQTYECPVQFGDGSIHEVIFNKAVYLDGDGTSSGIVGIILDITDRKRVEEQLVAAKEEAERANKIKSEFLASMSHELRTPMNAVLGFAQLMQHDPRNSLTPNQSDYIGHIIEGGNHLLELVNEILDLAKIEADHLSLTLEDVNSNDAVSDAVMMTATLGEKRKIVIDDQFSGRAPTFLQTDKVRFKQCLLNLLSNAVKYNNDGGIVTVDGEQTNDGFLRISITDEGCGIPKKDYPRMFQMFHRLDGDPTITKEGTGIGLTVTKMLIERMAGRIGFNSEVDVGSTFWIELPLVSNQNVLI